MNSNSTNQVLEYKPLKIGPYTLSSNVLLAPMAGISDSVYRKICMQQGAGATVAEMLTSDIAQWNSNKSSQRIIKPSDPEPRIVQISGTDAQTMASAAKLCVDKGAQIIDINMGCPAKKVCKSNAGSALLADEKNVANILEAVVNAVDAPVTLKIRTGLTPQQRNAINIAKIAESAGIQSLAIHGRTRQCMYNGNAEYNTIQSVKKIVSIPVIANGDINSPQIAKKVLAFTGANAIMIGRAAQGNPWIFNQVNYLLQNKKMLPTLSLDEIESVVMTHIVGLYSHYGNKVGVRVARKHITWYLKNYKGYAIFKNLLLKVEYPQQQQKYLKQFFKYQHTNITELAA
ncbi:MAG: tRNA dihydrouridine synthase DusB [Gammaproteobacteria bacterium]|nr:tRNA dihydrouridine synthase DusB [Gammaproteobacteria bacterium]